MEGRRAEANSAVRVVCNQSSKKAAYTLTDDFRSDRRLKREETICSWALVPPHEGSKAMSRTRILFAAMTVLGLAQFASADDRPESLPTPTQLAAPVMQNGSTGLGAGSSQYLGVTQASGSCPAGGCANGQCGAKSERSCWSAMCAFFTYRRAPYTDINTYFCGCSGPARPPLYVYMLHPCADQAPPRTLPDLSKCKGGGCGLCNKCGRQLEGGSGACAACGK